MRTEASGRIGRRLCVEVPGRVDTRSAVHIEAQHDNDAIPRGALCAEALGLVANGGRHAP